MKNLKIKIAIALVMLFMGAHVFAHQKSEKNIPGAVVASLNKKYPGATVKNWKVTDDVYTAKTILGSHKCFVMFYKDGNWLGTTLQLKWPWKLPKAVHTAYKKTKYARWNVYAVKKVEKPSGEFYQLMVENSNSQVDAMHQALFNTDKLLEFTVNGELTNDQDITGSPAP